MHSWGREFPRAVQRNLVHDRLEISHGRGRWKPLDVFVRCQVPENFGYLSPENHRRTDDPGRDRNRSTCGGSDHHAADRIG